MGKHLCKICGKKIVLTPSVSERVKKYGETPQFYRSIFQGHADCIIKKRSQESVDLMKKVGKVV